MTATKTPPLIDAALALAETLERENRALQAVDIKCAVALLADKQAAATSFTAAQAAPASLTAKQVALAREVATRLDQATAENKRLLERAITVQARVIAALASAVPAALPVQGYGATGQRTGRAPPLALRSRA
jgi:hypothetical protein